MQRQLAFFGDAVSDGAFELRIERQHGAEDLAERGKIVPRRLTGVCTTHQRGLARAIKQARNIALLPFAARY